MTSTALTSLEKKKLLEAKLAELKQARSLKESQSDPIQKTPLALPPTDGLLTPKNIAAKALSHRAAARLKQSVSDVPAPAKDNRYMQAVLPIKSRPFELACANGREVLEGLKQPGSKESFAFDTLLAWTALEAMPLSTLTPVIPVCGSTVLASGLAISLLHQHEDAASRQKIALLEWGQADACLGSFLNLDMPEVGLVDLFEKRCDLTHLILNAKLYRSVPNLYAIGQGTAGVDPMAHVSRFTQLLSALSKKFHRIVLSLPSFEAEPRLPQVLAALGMNYALFYDPNEALIKRQANFRRQWPNGIIQRITL
ncbi:MAG: hypothetical protein VKJ04_03435 [Vampirovibrionales bacterium]|nr:hypothetical protein [Vampirovibrionales bacterium]